MRLARVPGLTVVTNSLLVAQALAHANRVEVVMTGGTLRGSNYALVGSGAEQSLQGLRVSRAFLSGSGLTAERGLSTSNMLSASVDRALVQAAAEVVVLADHTKLGTDTMFQTVPTDLITRLVTDEPPAHDDRAVTELQALADQGVQIAVAGQSGGGTEGTRSRRGASRAGTCLSPVRAAVRCRVRDRSCAALPSWASSPRGSGREWRICAAADRLDRRAPPWAVWRTPGTFHSTVPRSRYGKRRSSRRTGAVCPHASRLATAPRPPATCP